MNYLLTLKLSIVHWCSPLLKTRLMPSFVRAALIIRDEMHDYLTCLTPWRDYSRSYGYSSPRQHLLIISLPFISWPCFMNGLASTDRSEHTVIELILKEGGVLYFRSVENKIILYLRSSANPDGFRNGKGTWARISSTMIRNRELVRVRYIILFAFVLCTRKVREQHIGVC